MKTRFVVEIDTEKPEGSRKVTTFKEIVREYKAYRVLISCETAAALDKFVEWADNGE